MSKNQKGGNSPNKHKKVGEAKMFLNHKTKRDTNSSNDELDPFDLITPKTRCSICLEFQIFGTQCYKCSVCSSTFHLDCYNFFNIDKNNKEEILNNNDINNFICMRCKEEKQNNTQIICSLCGEHDGILKKFDNNNYVHHYCYVLCKDNILNMINGNYKMCKICKKKGNCIECRANKCKEKYHIKCALEKNLIFSLTYYKGEEKIIHETFNDLILFQCKEHNEIFINYYKSILSAMTRSINDNIKDQNINKSNDNNPINIIQNNNNNNNNGEVISLNNEKENNNNNNNSNLNTSNINDDSKKIEIDNKSLNTNSLNDENYEDISNNDSKEVSEKTPPNNFSLKKPKSPTPENTNNNNDNNNNNISSIENNNNDIINVNLSKINNNIKQNDNVKKKENTNNNNINEDADVDIKMEIEEVKKSDNNLKEVKAEKEINKEIVLEEEEEEDVIITDNTKKINLDEKNEIKENEKEKEIGMEEYIIPEIKHEEINLFENFRKMNENYCYPGCFYRFHGL